MAAELAASTSSSAVSSSAMLKGTDAISRLSEAAENPSFQKQMFVPASSTNPLSVVSHTQGNNHSNISNELDESELNPVEKIVFQGKGGNSNQLKRNYEEMNIDDEAEEGETELVETVKVVQKQIPEAVFGGLAAKFAKTA